MSNTKMRGAKKPWTKGEKFLLGAILLVVVLAVTGGIWWMRVSAMPLVVVPTPTLPSPNAFDYFVAASDRVVDDYKVGFAGDVHKPGEKSFGGDHYYSPAQKAALVAENAPAIALLHQGFAYPYQNPPARSFSTLFPYYANFRGMARLLALSSKVKAEQGDWAGAANSGLDAVQLGEMMPRGGLLIGMLVGVACQAIGQRPLWAEIDHLSAAQAAAAAQRLEHIQQLHVPYADVLAEEKWMTQAGLLEIFHEQDQKGVQAIGGTGLPLLAMFVPRRTVMSNFTSYMDQDIRNARLPYAAKPPAHPIPRDPLNAIICPVLTGARIKDVDIETQNVLLMTALALQAYRQDKKTYPVALAALVPKYLARVPDDPFALSGPVHYRRQGSSYVLYSVGPDGRDDGGRPIRDISQPTTHTSNNAQQFSVKPDSVGDIVAGVNVY